MQFAICKCFTNTNIFLEKCCLHVKFVNEIQFLNEYKKILEYKGCVSRVHIDDVLSDIKNQIDERLQHHENSIKRQQYITINYRRLFPAIYHLKEEFLSPDFLSLIKAVNENVSFSELIKKVEIISNVEGVYRFPVFNETFIELFNKEIDSFLSSGMPWERPNTMNHNGVLLSELGFDDSLFTPLREELNKISRILYPDWVGEGLDTHRAFTVEYSLESDQQLACHYDNAEVTLNICLKRDFDGGDLYFGGMKNEPPLVETDVSHKFGSALLHRGRHMHGARNIISGHRRNLIIWMRSSSIRKFCCPRCYKTPQLIPVNGMGDGFLL